MFRAVLCLTIPILAIVHAFPKDADKDKTMAEKCLVRPEPGEVCCWMLVLGNERYFFNTTSKECQETRPSHCCQPELLDAFHSMEDCEKADCGNKMIDGDSGAPE